MTEILLDLIHDPQGMLLISACVLSGFSAGIMLMMFLEWLGERTRARLQRRMAMRPRMHIEIQTPETPMQRLVREAEQHERKSA